jgi:two-component system, chemotaxis family, protein-glutamate methylesterase/glutaminase
MIMREPARVFVIDPNPLARKLLGEVLSARADVVFLGSAATPGIAARRLAGLSPEVFIVDFETPVDASLAAFQALHDVHAAPAVVYTTLDGAALAKVETHPALAERELMRKAETRLADGVQRDAPLLCEAIARLALLGRMHGRAPRPEEKPAAPGRESHVASSSRVDAAQWIIAVGASTGGTQAVLRLLQALPPSAPGIVVVQHMPADFTKGFAQRLDDSCHFSVREAVGGERIVPGVVLIANGAQHLEVCGAPGRLQAVLRDGAKVSGHRPSVDVLFHSVARSAGAQAIGVLLTGMGDDGAAGLLDIRKAGGRTLAQDEESSTVFGMPRAAYERGAAEELAALPEMATRIMALLK